MVARVSVLVHWRKGVRAQRAPRTREARVMGARRTGVCIARLCIEMVLVRRPQRGIAVLLQFDERTLRDGRRIVRFVRRWRADVCLPRHRRCTGWVLVRAPEWGTQIGEIQRREWFVIHFGGIIVLERAQFSVAPPQYKFLRAHTI